MIPNIKKILYSTDLSEHARHAFGYAASLAHRYDARIIILHVLEQMSDSVSVQLASMMGQDRWDELMKRNENEARATIKERLERFCKEAAAEMSECPFVVESIVVEIGQPVDQILKQVAKSGADILVMGSHGQGGLAEVMLGSTARRVLRRCQKPVMTVRLPEGEE